MLPDSLIDHLKHHLGTTHLQFARVAGGSMSNAYHVVSGDGRHWFLKTNSATKFPHLFRCEAAGLKLLSGSGALAIPAVNGVLENQDWQALLLQWLEPGERSPSFWTTLGSSLARLHRSTGDCFGGTDDNYMGAVPQTNRSSTSWADFFREQRVEPLLRQCIDAGLLAPRASGWWNVVAARLDDLFSPSPPALLHGDLWHGNVMCGPLSAPFLVDPAVYYGHPAMDLGMTRLFGVFDEAFYDAYFGESIAGIITPEGESIATLYPLLVHVHLFGRMYTAKTETVLRRFG
ncbi:MAG: fructosamine kinase family protein [Flaviaesturariibacter sp.]|nr:fructosamine kinase family protein [Flaviaesturariibacter sp.]